jgi:hypothetical protein
MARDIEEFLRKAAERRRQQQAGKKETSQGAKQPNAPRSAPRRRPPAPIQAAEVIELSDDDVIEARPVRSRQPSQSKPQQTAGGRRANVQSEISSSKIAQHAEEIGRLKAAPVDDVDRVKQKFDRGASKFKSKHEPEQVVDSEIVGEEVSAVAADLVSMLRDPKSVRQAILVSEILRRPNFDD